jgi:carboxyl-terminal processing protease
VLDVRGNPGGVGGLAMGFAGHFIDSVVPIGVMQTRAQELKFAINPQRVNTRNERVTPSAGPVTVVTDGMSASATEIFAAGMQDLRRGRMVRAVAVDVRFTPRGETS